MVTEFSSLILAVAFALASLITISILERLANVEGNLLKQQHKQIQRTV